MRRIKRAKGGQGRTKITVKFLLLNLPHSEQKILHLNTQHILNLQAIIMQVLKIPQTWTSNIGNLAQETHKNKPATTQNPTIQIL